ncbi:ABC transporter ATP-binding protein [Natronospora cellulosivora (SeqCode)]
MGNKSVFAKTDLSAEIISKLIVFLKDDEELELAFTSDLSLEGLYMEQIVVLTNKRILNISCSEEWSVNISLNLDEIKSIRHQRLDSNNLVKIITKDRGVEILRCTSKLSPALKDFLEKVDEFMMDIFPQEKSFLDSKWSGGNGKQNIRRCAKCAKAISPRRNVCIDCLDKRKLFFRLMSYIKPHKTMFIIAFVLLAFVTYISLLPPLVNRVLIDDVLVPATGGGNELAAESGFLSNFLISFAPRGSISLLAVIVGLMFIINLLTSVMSTARMYLISWLGQKVIVDMRRNVYEHMQNLSLRFYNKESTGQLMSRVTSDVNRLQHFLSHDLQMLGQDVFTIILIIVILFNLSYFLTFLIILPAPLLVFLTFYFRNRLRRIYRSLWKKYAAINTVLADTIPGIRVVKAFAQEDKELDKFNHRNQQAFEGEIDSLKMRTIYQPTMQFLTFLGTITIWWFGGKQVIEGSLTIGTLMAFTGYMWQFYRPVQNLCNMNHRFQRIATSADRVFEVLDTQTDVVDAVDAYQLPEIKGELEFKDVSFTYEKEDNVLKDISFQVKPGEIIGLVGHSGAGKTTLINLICRFYDPQNGSIVIDGHDISEITTESLRQQIGVVLQEPFLFRGTIAENIAYGRPDASLAEIIAAAKAANSHDFIVDFPDAYETYVGERGVRLSGGQKQRISIARALLKDPRILILDEATASVDTETEAKIQEALERLVKGRTTFAIAHRLSTLRNADRLLVLEKGEIAEMGSHDELLEEDGIYARLYNMQREMKAI